MTIAIPEYDALYVVSDLHMGGEPGFQVMNQGQRLGKLLRTLARERPDDNVALVVNGDTIDSLAEGVIGYVAIDDADRMMRHLYRDPAFQPVWQGLAEFVKHDRRHLVFVLGNHDIEMALPHVEYSLRRELTQGDPVRQGRVTFATRGGGHACKVGHARVFCTHGNEVDDWNVVDYNALGRLAQSINAGQSLRPSEWTPNAGTRLVVDIMNDIKKVYPFVDLLKPETKAVVPILLALEPGRMKDVLLCLPRIVADKFWGGLRRRGILSTDEENLAKVTDARAAGDAAIEHLLGPNLRAAIDAPPQSEDALFLDVEESLASGADAREVEEGKEVETLGSIQYIVDRLRGIDKVEALRRALQDWLSEDDTFELDTEDDTYRRVTKKAGSAVDFVVTGHTHLERAIAIEPEQRLYYNSGTWIRLLRLRQSTLSDPQEFQRIYNVLRAGRMQELDDTTVRGDDGSEGPLVLRRSPVVKIASESGVVRGELLHAEDAGADDVILRPVPDSAFERR